MTTTLSTLATTPKQAVSTDVLVAQQLQELQHFAEIGRFSASLLHEISNPLTAAILELDPANPQPSLPQARRSLQLLRRYVEAARQQVQQQSPCRPFFAHRQIEQLKRVLKPLAQAAHVDLLLELAPRCRLQGDPVKFQQIIANLIINAIEAYGNDRASVYTWCTNTSRSTLVAACRSPVRGGTALSSHLPCP
jgi:signal transduction histidine kinase